MTSARCVPLEVVRRLAADSADQRAATQFLCEEDFATLKAAADTDPGAAVPNLAAYGPLAPRNFVRRTANDSMISWFASTVARIEPLLFAGSDTLRPAALYVHSQTTTALLRAHGAAQRGDTNARGKLLSSSSLKSSSGNWATLREFVSSRPMRGSLLGRVPYWRNIAFPLHHDSGAEHWSLAILSRQSDTATPTLTLHDSMFTSGPNHPVHSLLRALRDFNFVHADTALELAAAPLGQQLGGWQCGYAVMAHLCEMSPIGTVEVSRALNDSTWDANSTIESDERMQLFLRWIVSCNINARTIAGQCPRWGRCLLMN